MDAQRPVVIIGGGAIGLALYMSQAVSVAFYMIAFAEAFRPLAPWFTAQTGMAFDPRMVSLPGTVLLVLLMVTRGADLSSPQPMT